MFLPNPSKAGYAESMVVFRHDGRSAPRGSRSAHAGNRDAKVQLLEAHQDSVGHETDIRPIWTTHLVSASKSGTDAAPGGKRAREASDMSVKLESPTPRVVDM
jgi:hypothetical protein